MDVSTLPYLGGRAPLARAAAGAHALKDIGSRSGSVLWGFTAQLGSGPYPSILQCYCNNKDDDDSDGGLLYTDSESSEQP